MFLNGFEKCLLVDSSPVTLEIGSLFNDFMVFMLRFYNILCLLGWILCHLMSYGLTKENDFKHNLEIV